MAYYPKLQEVRSLLRLQPDPVEDGIITTALAAAIDYANRRLVYKYPIPPYDDGTLGFGDLGVVRVGRTDADVDGLYAACGPMVFG